MGKGGCINAPIAAEDLIGSNGKGGSKSRDITTSFLASKNTIDECWIAYEGNVYDVTHWLRKHPGGIRSIMSVAGQDASSVMKSLHAPSTLETYMKRIRKVGQLIEEPEILVKNHDASSKEKRDMTVREKNAKASWERNRQIHDDFGRLNEKLIQEHWYDTQPLNYTIPILRSTSFLVMGVYLSLWYQTGAAQAYTPLVQNLASALGAILIGFFFQSTAFMGHDAGHGSVLQKLSWNNVFGIMVGNLTTGIDIGWWKSTHYVHHCATNSLHDDPDIQHMPLLCFEERMADGRWSTYHSKYMPLDDIAKAIIPYQHYFFYPIMGVARINLYIQSILYVLKTNPFMKDDGKSGEKIIHKTTGEVKEQYAWPKQTLFLWSLSMTTLGMFWTAMYSFYSQMNLEHAVPSFLLTHFVAGLLHVQILVSHTAMDYCCDGHGATGVISDSNANDQAGYYEWQALSTMDVDCPTWMDWFHGGLQFQLEHHLFPRVPRWRLRELSKLTDEIFAKYDIPVVRMTFVDGNIAMLKHLANIGDRVSKKHIQKKLA